MYANDTIQATFFTRGILSYCGFDATVTSGTTAALSGLRVSLKTETGTLISTTDAESNLSKGHLYFSSLAPGNYQLYLYNTLYPDFQLDTVSFTLLPGTVLDLDTLSLLDSIAPVITAAGSQNDSISFADTLLFHVKEGGITLSRDNFSILFNGSTYTNWSFKTDTLRIIGKKNTSPLWQPLIIKITDKFLNITKHSYYVSPASLFIKSLPDTTIASDSGILIPIWNIMPNMTPERFYWDIDADGLWDIEKAADEASQSSQLFTGSLFHEKTTTVKVAILYTNGILATTSFTVTLLNRAPVSTFAECITPCNVAASSTSATFKWHPGYDADGDVLHYRVVYFAGSSATFTEADWIFATELSTDTSATVRNLPEGYIRWWVQAIDSEGAISEIWNPTSLVAVTNDEGSDL
jgi:hypothetical protein